MVEYFFCIIREKTAAVLSTRNTLEKLEINFEDEKKYFFNSAYWGDFILPGKINKIKFSYPKNQIIDVAIFEGGQNDSI